MKNYFAPTLGMFILAAIITLQCSNKPSVQEGLSMYLPDLGEMSGWKPVGNPQHAEGESLFELINGGAEIYNEYGFRRAIMHSYSNKSDKSVNLEMYEMEDPISAYGIYTFKISGNGQEVDFGDGGMLEDYYLNFRKGNFIVTLIGFDTDRETKDAILTMAKSIETNIETEGQVPDMVHLLVQENLKKSSVTYIQGNLGLFNYYEFDTRNIFGVKEGVIGQYGDYDVFIFRYADAEACKKWFREAQTYIQDDPSFDEYAVSQDGFSFSDLKGNYLFVKSFQNCILIYLGRRQSYSKNLLKKYEDNILNHQEVHDG